jgi:hypothetical protein
VIVLAHALAAFETVALVTIVGLGYTWRLWGPRSLRSLHRSLRELRARRAIARVQAAAMVDEDFGDTAPVETARMLYATVEAERPDRDKVAKLLGTGAAWWLFEHSKLGEGFWAVGRANIALVRVLQRDTAGPRRVVVRVRASLVARRPSSLPDRLVTTHDDAVAFWTLVRDAGGWNLALVEDGWRGVRHLAADPGDLRAREAEAIRDAATIESATADAAGAPEGLTGARRVVGTDDARATLLDLSVVDGRFAPAVLERSVGRVLRAWEDTGTGDASALGRVASAAAIRQLKRASSIENPWIEGFAPVEVDTRRRSASVVVMATARGAAVGLRREICWRLTLTDERDLPWRLADAEAWKDTYLWRM